MAINTQAAELNQVLEHDNPAVLRLLSDRGKAIYFPKEGIVAQSAEAKGKRINATAGIAVEDDGSPMRLKPIAEKVLLDPKDVFTYASSFGKQELREAWQQHVKDENPSVTERMSMPVATGALTHGLSVAGYLFVNPGDRIYICDKFWGNYRLIFEATYGAQLETYNTFAEGHLDIQSLREKLKRPGKKILLLNFPNNPAGYSPTIDEADSILDAVRESADEGNDIAVLVDDAYFGLTYEPGILRESLFGRLARLHKNVIAVKIDGPTKEAYVWGLRVGFLTFSYQGISEEACKALEAKTAGAVRGTISNVAHLSQSLILHALRSAEYATEKKRTYAILKARYDEVKRVLSDPRFADEFMALPFNAGYFMCVQLSHADAETVRKTLLARYDTGVISQKNLLRIAFSSVKKTDIQELFDNIYRACNEVHHGSN